MPRAIVERYLVEVLNGGPRRADASLISDPSLAQRMARFREAFPDLEVETRVLLSEGDLVGGHFAARGTHLGLFQGAPPAGRRWTASCTAIYRVEHGKIAQGWVSWDLLSLMEQLGAVRRAETVSA